MTSLKKNADRAINLALVLLRHLTGLTQAEFGKAARISAAQMSEYERGKRPMPRRLLDRAARAADFPLVLLEPLLRELRAFLAAARGWSSARGTLVGTLFTELVELLAAVVEAVLDLPAMASSEMEARPPCAEDREAAEGRWAHLEKLTGEQRLAVVEELEEYQSWALCERVAAASIEVPRAGPRRRSSWPCFLNASPSG